MKITNCRPIRYKQIISLITAFFGTIDLYNEY